MKQLSLVSTCSTCSCRAIVTTFLPVFKLKKNSRYINHMWIILIYTKIIRGWARNNTELIGFNWLRNNKKNQQESNLDCVEASLSPILGENFTHSWRRHFRSVRCRFILPESCSLIITSIFYSLLHSK